MVERKKITKSKYRICALLLRTLFLIQFYFSNSGLSLDFDFLETSGDILREIS